MSVKWCRTWCKILVRVLLCCATICEMLQSCSQCRAAECSHCRAAECVWLRGLRRLSQLVSSPGPHHTTTTLYSLLRSTHYYLLLLYSPPHCQRLAPAILYCVYNALAATPLLYATLYYTTTSYYFYYTLLIAADGCPLYTTLSISALSQLHRTMLALSTAFFSLPSQTRWQNTQQM